MQFGVQFFPDVRPEEKSAEAYFQEALDLAEEADRPSFGCQADRTYTVFDECLLAALPRAPTWRAVHAVSRGCVRAREKRLGVLPSEPQASFGAAVRNLPVR